MQKLLGAFLSRQFAIYICFGGLAALVNLAVGWLLYSGERAVLPYWVAVFIGAASGLLVNFFCNYIFNFKYRHRTAWKQFQTFFVVSVIGTFLTATISWLILHLATIAAPSLANTAMAELKFAAHVVAVFFVTFYSFLAHKYFSFNVGLRTAFARLLNRQEHPSVEQK